MYLKKIHYGNLSPSRADKRQRLKFQIAEKILANAICGHD